MLHAKFRRSQMNFLTSLPTIYCCIFCKTLTILGIKNWKPFCVNTEYPWPQKGNNFQSYFKQAKEQRSLEKLEKTKRFDRRFY
ncbi:hypothetical protein EB796_015245 [Bugula neritina]|uniref:Uncharacterized protein n=1 Tax=Bugula neritina TaxID=10212 RepID=A0A7J7JJZ5_BUGNE|nr:hypothetical protein EB796_015245 [Bugula neritina]